MNVKLGKLAGKTVLITAAGQGIGRATVEVFAREGANVHACDINDTAINELNMIEGVSAFHLDVTNGYVASGSILECDEKDWDFSFDLNVKAMYRLIKLTLPSMLENGGGSIINMSSVASSLKGVPNRFVYCASKAAVIGMTKAVAADFVTKGIRCNAICPGTVDSPSLHDRLRDTGDYDKALTDFIARQPMGRVGRAYEIAMLALYLASDDSSFTTGQTHAIDGGWSI